MRYDYLESFIESVAFELEDLLKREIMHGRVYYRSTAMPPQLVLVALRSVVNLAKGLTLDIEEGIAIQIANAFQEAGAGRQRDSAFVETSLALFTKEVVGRTQTRLEESWDGPMRILFMRRSIKSLSQA